MALVVIKLAVVLKEVCLLVCYKLVILSPALLTLEVSDQFGDDHLVPDDRGSCKGPHQTATRL